MTKQNQQDSAHSDALTDDERQELEALRKASRRQNIITDYANTLNAIMPSATASLNQLQALINAWMKEQGFWDSDNFGEKVALIHSELSEALEAHRGGLHSDHLQGVPGVAEELADTVIRCLDLCGQLGIPLGQIIHMKMQYNFTRPHKHGKAY